MEITAQDLRRIALFAGLSEPTLARMVRAARVRVYTPGEIVIFAGDPCEAVYFILEGEARVYRLSSAGREQVLARLGAGEAFNLVPPFRDSALNHATVAAFTPLTLCIIGCEDFRRLAGECLDLTLAILREFAARLDRLTNLVEDLSLRSVRERLARFLLAQAAPNGGKITQRWTHDEIAAHLGTVRDVVGRTLRAFADAGLVHLDRQRIILLDREGLEAEAGY